VSVKIDGSYKTVEYPMTDYLNKNILVTRVLDSDNKVLKLFINGVKVGEKTFTNNVYETTDGRYYLNSPSKDSFSGNINSLKVYNKPLTDSEIQHNYQLEKERWGL
ncbi:MAG: LamG domain-containing protein, partial [Alkalibacterium sp.]|nr:LamG domain-containing protein [Alkalibacterium sp.]